MDGSNIFHYVSDKYSKLQCHIHHLAQLDYIHCSDFMDMLQRLINRIYYYYYYYYHHSRAKWIATVHTGQSEWTSITQVADNRWRRYRCRNIAVNDGCTTTNYWHCLIRWIWTELSYICSSSSITCQMQYPTYLQAKSISVDLRSIRALANFSKGGRAFFAPKIFWQCPKKLLIF